MTRPIGSINARRRDKPVEPSRFAGIDFSIPEESDHDKHVRAVLSAWRGGFPVLRK